MRRLLIALASLLLVTSAFAQLDSNSVTVTATRNTYLPPDQVVFSVVVISPSTANLDQVVAPLQAVGITADNLTGVTTPLTAPSPWFDVAPVLQWTFSLKSSLNAMKATIASLSALQKSFAADHPGMTLSFIVQGVQVSPEAQAAVTCSRADLIADARNEAQKLTDAGRTDPRPDSGRLGCGCFDAQYDLG